MPFCRDKEEKFDNVDQDKENVSEAHEAVLEEASSGKNRFILEGRHDAQHNDIQHNGSAGSAISNGENLKVVWAKFSTLS